MPNKAARAVFFLLVLACALGREEAWAATAQTVSGKVFFQRAGRKSWEAMRIGRIIKKGDKIATGGASEAKIGLDDRSFFEMKPHTIVVLKGGKSGIDSLSLLKGTVTASFGAHAGGELRILTPLRTYSGENSVFRVALDERGKDSHAVASGLVGAEDRMGDIEWLVPHWEVKVKAKGQEFPPSVSTDTIAFSQILANPDNISLNIRYAHKQLAGGQLRNAIPTLERILMIDPELHQVRLLYAATLFKTENYSDAETEFGHLRDLNLSKDLRPTLDAYLEQIRKRRRRAHFSGILSLGYDYLTNNNDSPSASQLLIFGNPVELTGAALKTQDTAIVTIGSVRASRDFTGGHEAFGSFSYYRAEQNVLHYTNIQVFSGQSGATFKTPYFNFTPMGDVDHIRLAQETFLRSFGGGVKAEKQFSRFSLSFEGRAAYQYFSRTAIVPTGSDHSGRLLDFSSSFGYAVSPLTDVSVGYAWSRKEAAQRFWAYTRHSLSFNHTWVLTKGYFFLTSLAVNFDQYDIADDFISPQRRNDTTYRTRLTFGVPLLLASRRIKDLIFTQSYEYYHADSNLLNYSYDNNKLSSLLTYKWGL